MAGKVHHSAICAHDFDASLRFYRDGLGLEVMMDSEFDGDWPTLFGAKTSRLHSVFLGDPSAPDAGVVELVSFDSTGRRRETPARAATVGKAAAAVDMLPTPPTPSEPGAGFFLLSLYVGDVDAALARLRELGLGGEPTRIAVSGPGDSSVAMATVRDPDGVLVELIGI